MFKHDLQARPIYHHTRESIDVHLAIVFAARAVSHYIEHQTDWSIKKFVRTTRRYRTVKIKAGRQTLTAADPLPDDLRDALAKIDSNGAHELAQLGTRVAVCPDQPGGVEVAQIVQPVADTHRIACDPPGPRHRGRVGGQRRVTSAGEQPAVGDRRRAGSAGHVQPGA
jgi:hypothetical protein